MINYEISKPAQADGRDVSEAGWVDGEGVNRISEKAINRAGELGPDWCLLPGVPNFAQSVAFSEQRGEDS